MSENHLHLVGGIGLFVALGLEFALLVRLRNAHTAEQARPWLSLTAFQRPVGLASLVIVLVAGLYMVVTAWGAVAWISVTLASLLVMMAFGAYNGLTLAPLERALHNERGTLGGDRLGQTRNSLLLTSVHCRAGILLGVLVIGIALLLGLLSVLPILARRQAVATLAKERA